MCFSAASVHFGVQNSANHSMCHDKQNTGMPVFWIYALEVTTFSTVDAFNLVIAVYPKTTFKYNQFLEPCLLNTIWLTVGGVILKIGQWVELITVLSKNIIQCAIQWPPILSVPYKLSCHGKRDLGLSKNPLNISKTCAPLQTSVIIILWCQCLSQRQRDIDYFLSRSKMHFLGFSNQNNNFLVMNFCKNTSSSLRHLFNGISS